MSINLTVVIDNEEAVRKFRELQKTARTVTSSVVTDADRMDIAMRRIATTLGQIGVAVSLTGLIRQIALTRGEFQQLEVAFSTLLQSKEKADKLMAEMVDLAAKTPFDLQGVASGARQLLAYGFAAEEITDTLTRLGNVAAGLGLPLERLTYLYGTTAVQGRLYARDMLQFTSSGIPVLQEMAKMYGKTTEEINKMVTDGKIGFEDVRKVIENMTNEGGQFYNLMQEQSKTITGLISNLGDALDTMFNDIGMSQEGVISDVLKGTISLVENYQKVLDILIPLVATYGAYKTALIVTAALQKASVTASSIKAFFDLAKGINTAKDAQLLFNMAVKGNPLGLALSVLTLLGTAAYKYANGAYRAADAQKLLSDNMAEAASSAAIEQSELARLKGKLQACKEGTEEYDRVKNEIIKKFGKYDEGLKAETLNVDTLAQKYNSLTEAIMRSYNARQYDKFSQEQTAAFDETATENYNKIFKVLTQKYGEELGTQYGVELQKAISGGIVRVVQNSGGILRISGLENFKSTIGGALGLTNQYEVYSGKVAGFIANIVEAQDELRKTDELARKRFGIEGVVSTTTNEAETSDITSLSDAIAAAREKLAGLKSELADLMADKLPKGAKSDFNWAKAIKEKQKAIKEQEEELNTLIGYDPKQAKKTENNIKKLSEANIQAQREATQAEIDAMQDGTAKKLAQIDLDFQKQIDSINKGQKDLEKTQGKPISKEQQSWFDRMKNTAYIQRNRSRGNILLSGQVPNTELATLFDQELQTWNDYLIEYGTFSERLQATKDKYDRKLAESKTEGERASIQAEYDSTLAAFEVQASAWAKELADLSAHKLERLMNQTEERLDAAKKAFDSFENSSSPEAKQWQDTINQLQGRIKVLEAQLNKTKKAASDRDWAKAANLFQNIGSGARDAANEIRGFDEGLADILTTIANITSGVGAMIAAITAIGKAISAAEKASAILAVISAAIQVVSGLFSIFSNTETSMERNIRLAEEFNEELRIMNERAKINSDAFSSIFGDNAWGNYANNINILNEAASKYGDTLERVKKRGKEVVVDFGEYGGRANLQKVDKTWESATDSVANMLVQTRHSTWFRSAKYKSLKDLLPELFEGNEINMENLKEFVDSNNDTFKHLGRENQEYLKEMVANWDTYQQAVESVNDYLTDMLGDLGSSLTDALVDSFESGTDAAEAFGDVVGDMLKNMAKQVLYNATLAPLINEAQAQIEEINKNSALSDEDRFNAYAKVIGDLMDQVLAEQEAGQDVWERLQKMAEEKGIDWTDETTSSQNATSRGFQAMSQDTGDELNGRFTDMQGKMNILVSGMDMLRSINMETRNTSIDIRDIMIQLNGNVADIRTFTKVLPEMSSTLNSMNRKLDNI